MNKVLKIALASTVLVSGLTASDIVKGSGASFPYSVYQKWIKAYNKDTGLKIDYIKKGSSKGIKDAKARAVDFAGTDKPLSPIMTSAAVTASDGVGVGDGVGAGNSSGF